MLTLTISRNNIALPLGPFHKYIIIFIILQSSSPGYVNQQEVFTEFSFISIPHTETTSLLEHWVSFRFKCTCNFFMTRTRKQNCGSLYTNCQSFFRNERFYKNRVESKREKLTQLLKVKALKLYIPEQLIYAFTRGGEVSVDWPLSFR